MIEPLWRAFVCVWFRITSAWSIRLSAPRTASRVQTYSPEVCGSRRFVRGPKIRLARIGQVLWFPVAKANHTGGEHHWCSRSPSKHWLLPTAAPRSTAELEIVADFAILSDRSSRTFSEGGYFPEIEVMISQKLISFQAYICGLSRNDWQIGAVELLGPLNTAAQATATNPPGPPSRAARQTPLPFPIDR